MAKKRKKHKRRWVFNPVTYVSRAISDKLNAIAQYCKENGIYALYVDRKCILYDTRTGRELMQCYERDDWLAIAKQAVARRSQWRNYQ